MLLLPAPLVPARTVIVGTISVTFGGRNSCEPQFLRRGVKEHIDTRGRLWSLHSSDQLVVAFSQEVKSLALELHELYVIGGRNQYGVGNFMPENCNRLALGDEV